MGGALKHTIIMGQNPRMIPCCRQWPPISIFSKPILAYLFWEL